MLFHSVNLQLGPLPHLMQYYNDLRLVGRKILIYCLEIIGNKQYSSGIDATSHQPDNCFCGYLYVFFRYTGAGCTP